MSSALSSLLALLLCMVVLAPLVWASTGRHVRAVAISYVACILAVAEWQTGFLQQGSLARTDVVPHLAAPDASRCKEVIGLVRGAGLTFDRADPNAPKLVGPKADTLPPEVRDIVLTCAKTIGI